MIVYEPQCIGYEHAEINAAYLILLRCVFPNSRIVFYADKTHIEAVSIELRNRNVAIDSVEIYIIPFKKAKINSFLLEMKNTFFVFMAARKQKDIVLLSSITSASLLVTKLLSSFVKRKIYIVLHGVLETIFREPKGLLRRLYWFRNYFCFFHPENIVYVLNGESIRNNFLKKYESFASRTIAQAVPYFFDNRKPARTHQSTEQVVFGCAGVGAVAKGSHLFFKLARDIQRIDGRRISKFKYIGHFVDDKMYEYVNEDVVIPSIEVALSRSEYEAQFDSIDYLVLFYPRDSYRYSASGILFDAVKFNKPLLAIRNDYFEYFFQKYGKLGWLCTSYEELMSIAIELLKGHHKSEIDEITENYRKIVEDFTIDAQSSKLASVLS